MQKYEKQNGVNFPTNFIVHIDISNILNQLPRKK